MTHQQNEASATSEDAEIVIDLLKGSEDDELSDAEASLPFPEFPAEDTPLEPFTQNPPSEDPTDDDFFSSIMADSEDDSPRSAKRFRFDPLEE